jgi:hypothetical protein
MNLLKQTIEQQRQRRSNSNSKENSFDDKAETEQQVNYSNIDKVVRTADLPRSRDGGDIETGERDRSKLTCKFSHDMGCSMAYQLQTSDTDNHVTNIDTASDKMDTVLELEPAVARVRHNSSDPVMTGSETFASLLNFEISPKVMPRKIAMVDVTGNI